MNGKYSQPILEIKPNDENNIMFRKYLYIFVGWTLLLGGSLLWTLHQLEHNTLNNAAAVARASLAKDIGFRDWVGSHGGIYVQPSAHTPPNPYLKVPDRDVVTTTGMKLTLMNPAYVIREVQDDFNGNKLDLSHLTSLKLLNPNNKPDEWEIKALKSFEQGANELMEVANIGDVTYLRLMKPLFITEGCLKCHAIQGYKVGEVRGGIGAYVKMRPYTEEQSKRVYELSLTHGVIWLFGLIGLGVVSSREKIGHDQRLIDDAEIYFLAYHDTLTKLPNRRLMLDKIKKALSASATSQLFGAVFFVDLDNFKTVNDTLGHEYGDLLLVEVSTRIKDCVSNRDTVARMGGDDFVVLLESVDVDFQQATQKVAKIAEEIRRALISPYDLNKKEYASSASIGVSIYRGEEVSISSLLKHTDMAMYRAKESGRDAVRFFDNEMKLAVEMRAAMEADLRRAVSERQMQLYYQIQVDSEHRALGAEALIRWIHPLRGIVSPADFIPLAEESSLILEIGEWVFETACKQLAIWSKQEKTMHLTLAVNVSAKQFQQPDFVETVKALLHTYGFDASHLKIELTESVVLRDVTEVISKMYALKALGVKLSMDDFGTGYSSLSYLKQLPLDQIKIDQSFVRDMTSDQNDAVMVQTMIDLGKNFHLNIIAEGVENAAQESLLKHLGCMAYQGYLFSKPVPIDEFEALLTKS